jgi:AcrR family transcriptional regulator
VTKGTLYLYFQSKDDLFKAVVREALIPNLERFEALAAATRTPVALLEQLIFAWQDLIVENPAGALPKLVIAEAGNFPELARFYLDEVIDRGRKLVGSLLAQAVEQGEVRADLDIESTVTCVIAPLVLSALWKHSLEPYDRHGPMDRRLLAKTHARLLRDALQAPRKDPE